jgi:hypothetical protein
LRRAADLNAEQNLIYSIVIDGIYQISLGTK